MLLRSRRAVLGKRMTSSKYDTDKENNFRRLVRVRLCLKSLWLEFLRPGIAEKKKNKRH